MECKMKDSKDIKLSRVAAFDDLMRFAHAIFEFDVTEGFLEFAQNQELCRKMWLETVVECRRLQCELENSIQTNSDLEKKLYHARRLLDNEKKLRKKAEEDVISMEKSMGLARDILFNDHRNKLADETREKLAFLNNTTRKSRRLNTITELDSTGSLLSDLSYSRSEDDLDYSVGMWKRHRPSMVAETPTRSKKHKSSSNRVVEIDTNDRVVATTTLSVDKNGGPITATSIIEAVPQSMEQSPLKEFTPSAAQKDNLDEIAKIKYNSPYLNSGDNRHYRQHTFALKPVLKPETCGPCGKRIRFGKMVGRCRDCRAVAHTECQNLVPLPCVPMGNTPNMKGTMGCISDYTPTSPPMIPALIVHCVNEVELRGLSEIGLYRIPGSEKDVKVLKEKFLRGKGVPNLTSIEIPVICGTLKDFLRSLREPIVTHLLWPEFVKATESESIHSITLALYNIISELPQPNRDTLAFLMLHLQKVAESKECKMPIENLAKVFGPTIVGYSSSDPDVNDIVPETHAQVQVMEHFLKIPTDYWATFINVSIVPSTLNELLKTPSTDSLLHTNRRGIFTPLGRERSSAQKRKFFGTPPQKK